MTEPNYYEPPGERREASDPKTNAHLDLPDGWVPCPGCGGGDLEMPNFTWWGGMVGQKLLNHVKCQSCGMAFNAKSGKSNTPAIVAYQVIAGIVVLAVIYGLGLFD